MPPPHPFPSLGNSLTPVNKAQNKICMSAPFMLHTLSRGETTIHTRSCMNMLKSDRTAEGNRFFLAIANNAGDIIHFNSAEKPIHNPGRAIESLLGYGPGTLSGHPAMEIIHPDDRKIVMNAMASTIEGSALPVHKIRLLKMDGTLIDARMSTFHFEIDGQGRIGAVMRHVSMEKTALKKSERHHDLHQEFEPNRQKTSMNASYNVLPVLSVIPICMYCKKIRNESGSWMHPATYLQSHTGADLSHGICPECARTHFTGFGREKIPTDDDD